MSGFSNPAQWLLDALNGGESGTIRATPQNLLRCPPLWYAVNRICSHVGQLPMDLRKNLERGSEKADTDPRWRLIRKKPNGLQIPSVFKEQLTLHMLIMGDARSYIARAGSRILEIIPLDPYRTATGLILGEKVHVCKPDENDRILQYETPDKNGRITLFDEQVCHMPNLSIDGVVGERLYELAKDTIKTGIGADRRTSKGMDKGFTGRLILEAPRNAFSKASDAQEFLDDFRKTHNESQDGETIGLLRNDIKHHVVQMSNHDAQFIEQRRFQRQEAALWFLLESIVGDDTSVSYNSLEQKTLAYLQNTLNRWLRRWEEEFDAKLLSETEQNRMFFRFNTAPLLRSDLNSTLQALNTAVVSRIMSPNEAREKLDMNPYVGGDTYENPAISPGSPGSGDKNTDKAPDMNPNKARAAIVSRLTHMLNIEHKRVSSRMTEGGAMKKIESFYVGWVKTLGDVIEELEGDPTLAQEHCDRVIQSLVANEGLFSVPEAVEELTDKIMGVM